MVFNQDLKLLEEIKGPESISVQTIQNLNSIIKITSWHLKSSNSDIKK